MQAATASGLFKKHGIKMTTILRTEMEFYWQIHMRIQLAASNGMPLSLWDQLPS